MDLSQPHIIELPRIYDPRGSLTFVEDCNQIPFKIHRAYWIYDIPGGEERGGHSHRQLQEFLVAVNGSFDVTLDDGYSSRTFMLNRPFRGLYIPPGYWRVLTNFSSGSVCLAIVSMPYSEVDYVRDYSEFKSLTTKSGPKFLSDTKI